MAKKFKLLRDKMSPESQKRSLKKFELLKAGSHLVGEAKGFKIGTELDPMWDLRKPKEKIK